ncbi:helix-turn-helix domain-containing protein, partial [Corallococcus sp. AB049A]|uniref:helix-turn-helix domain-containing protein n=1 Tax=Corallococcus sp. AB049A TaxID=2316721 RepID=UPI000EDFDEE6
MQELGVKLKQAEKEALDALMRRGRQSVRVLKRARALQLLGEGWTGVAAAEAAGLSERTVRQVRGRYRREGFDAALQERPRPGRQRRFTPGQASQVVALVCSSPPQGHARWTLSLLVREVVGRGIVPQVGMETVRELLQRHDLKPWRENVTGRGNGSQSGHPSCSQRGRPSGSRRGRPSGSQRGATGAAVR